MNPFTYQRAAAPEEAVHAISARKRKISRRRHQPHRPDEVRRRDPPRSSTSTTSISPRSRRRPSGGAMIGALVRNCDLANHAMIRQNYPLLSQGLLSGASRNSATWPPPAAISSSAPAAITSWTPPSPPATSAIPAAAARPSRASTASTRSSACRSTNVASPTNPSDMNVAMAALDATVHVQGPGGKTRYRLRRLPPPPRQDPADRHQSQARRAHHRRRAPPAQVRQKLLDLKVRDRQSYAFALVSVAALLTSTGGNVQCPHCAGRCVAHKPWHAVEAERQLIEPQRRSIPSSVQGEAAVTGARGYGHNDFKIAFCSSLIVARALAEAAAQKER